MSVSLVLRRHHEPPVRWSVVASAGLGAPEHAAGQRTRAAGTGGLHQLTNVPCAVQVIGTVPRGWRVRSSNGLRRGGRGR